MISRDLVHNTLEKNNPPRIPRQMWLLPAMVKQYPEQVKKIQDRYPDDITWSPDFKMAEPFSIGNLYKKGEYTDPWGCRFSNLQDGIIGEVKETLISDENWGDVDKLKLPEEFLQLDINKINNYCRNTDKFILSGFGPRPFERLQWIRGTEQIFMDLILEQDGLDHVIKKIHDFYCKIIDRWCSTEIDAVFIQDDWGSQHSLLINPELWRKVFKPLYKQYSEIVKSHNKKLFMHSDGNIAQIYPDLIEIGVDALNSQIACMNLDELAKYKGQITFWGEIDRQNLLVNGTPSEVNNEVKKIYQALWADGGCIAQCSFDLGGKPDNVQAVFEAWNNIKKE